MARSSRKATGRSNVHLALIECGEIDSPTPPPLAQHVVCVAILFWFICGQHRLIGCTAVSGIFWRRCTRQLNTFPQKEAANTVGVCGLFLFDTVRHFLPQIFGFHPGKAFLFFAAEFPFISWYSTFCNPSFSLSQSSSSEIKALPLALIFRRTGGLSYAAVIHKKKATGN